MGASWRSGRVTLALIGLGCAASTAGCTSGPGDPDATAQTLAQALSAADLSAVPFATTAAEQAQASFDGAVAGMPPAAMSVTVEQTTLEDSPDGQRAIATMAVAWDYDGPGPDDRTWTYSTQAELVPAPPDGEPGWQVRWSPTIVHPDLSDADALALRRSQAPRADIVTTDADPLVTARPVGRVGLDKVRVDGDADAAARELAAVVGIDPDEYAGRVAAAGDEAFVEAIVLREVDAAALVGAVEAIDGGRVIEDELPLAPTREFARALIGTVGTATAEVVQESGGAVVGTDLVGLSGLQQRYDAQLRGMPGYQVVVVGSDDEGRAVHQADPIVGDDLVMTLDPTLQQRADDLLADVGSPSAIVALRPSTGELLAVASGPASDDYSTATLGRYAPGSVFKVVSALALGRTGLAPDDTVTCSPSTVVDGKQFVNYSAYPADALGDISLRTAFAESCNTAFVDQVDTVTWEEVADAAAALGVGTDSDLGVDTFAGDLGDAATRVDRAAGLIGQGPVLVSPLAAATMAASVGPAPATASEAGAASAGGPVTPLLLPDLAGVDTAQDSSGGSASDDERSDLLSMMRLAVTDGTASVLEDVPGEPVAAKTGTAEFGTADPPQTHGWMVAVQGDLAAAVFVEQAESGSATAGPIMRDLLAAASDLPGP